MAAFSVVMRPLSSVTYRQTHIFKRFFQVHISKNNLISNYHQKNVYALQILPNTCYKTSFSLIKRHESSQSQNKPPSPPTQSFQCLSKDTPLSDLNNPNLNNTKDEKKSDESGKKDSFWRGKNSWRLGLILLGTCCVSWGVGLVYIWGAPQVDPDGKEVVFQKFR
ncbi:unnamed protein product [Lymnaea stagnalis]|uniref:Uncharacterized protein n=1 Tax=Lymnaea stagnalis TaxID=6523 RepID=A0AAV2GXV4_LYMST